MNAVKHLQALVFRILGMILWLAPLGAFGAIAAVVGKTGCRGDREPRHPDGRVLHHVRRVHLRDPRHAAVRGHADQHLQPDEVPGPRVPADRRHVVVGVGAAAPHREDGAPRRRPSPSSASPCRPATRSTSTAPRSTSRWRRCSSPPAWARRCRIPEQIGLLVFMVIASKGAAGVTGAGLATLAGGLQAYRPDLVNGVGVIVGIDRFMSEGRAVTNFTGNAVATVLIGTWTKEIDAIARAPGAAREDSVRRDHAVRRRPRRDVGGERMPSALRVSKRRRSPRPRPRSARAGRARQRSRADARTVGVRPPVRAAPTCVPEPEAQGSISPASIADSRSSSGEIVDVVLDGLHRVERRSRQLELVRRRRPAPPDRRRGSVSRKSLMALLGVLSRSCGGTRAWSTAPCVPCTAESPSRCASPSRLFAFFLSSASLNLRFISSEPRRSACLRCSCRQPRHPLAAPATPARVAAARPPERGRATGRLDRVALRHPLN